MVVGLVQASGLPTYLVGPDVPGGVVTVSAGVTSVSVDAVLPEGYGVVGVYAVGGNSPSLSVNNRDTNTVSWMYSPSGAFNVSGVGTFNERMLFNPPGLRDGLVTLTSSGAWSFGSATNVVAVAIEGDPSGETTWVVGYVPPPTATEITTFVVFEQVSTNVSYIRKLVDGKPKITGTNIVVTVTASYTVGIGNTDATSACVWGEKLNSLGQLEYFALGTMQMIYTGKVLTQIPTSIPKERTGKYFVMAYHEDGSSEVAASIDLKAPPPPNTN